MPRETPPAEVESNVAVAPVCGSVNTICLAVTVPPVPFCGSVVTIERSPSTFEFPDTSNLNPGDLPTPRLPAPLMITSAVPPWFLKERT